MVIDESAEKKIISLWLFELLDPRGIEEKIGIPKSRGYRIINAFRKETPGIEDFREMWKSCKKPNLSPVDLVRMLNLVERFNGLGTSIATLIGAVSIVNEQGEQAGAAVSSALVLQDRAIKSGKGFPEIVAEENRLRDSEEALKIEISALQAEKESLTQELPNLRELRDLQNKLDEKKIDTGKLDGFIDDHVEYTKNGFNTEAAKVIASELGKLGLDPIAGSRKIAEIISKHGDLQKFSAFFLRQEEIHKERLLERGREDAKVEKEIAEKRRYFAETSSDLQKEFDNQKRDVENQKKDLGNEIIKLEKNKANLQSELEELNQKRTDVEIELGEKQHKISIAETVYSFLSNPMATPRDRLTIVADWINGAKREWGAGRSGDNYFRFAHGFLIEILRDVVKAESCSKRDYDELSVKFTKCQENTLHFMELLPEFQKKLEVQKVWAKEIQVRDSVIQDISLIAAIQEEEEMQDLARSNIPRHPRKEYFESSNLPTPSIPATPKLLPKMRSLDCTICKRNISLSDKGVLSVKVSYFCKGCNNSISESIQSLYQREVQGRMKHGIV